jgi:hypothetical protein
MSGDQYARGQWAIFTHEELGFHRLGISTYWSSFV